ncbi:MAG: cell division protein FtsA [Chitinophagales bacterium]
MTEKNNIIVGLDIGTTKISVIVAKKSEDGNFEILGTGKSVSNGVMRGEVANIDKTVEAIKSAVTEAENNSSYEITEVYAGIAGSHIKSMQHRGILTRENSQDEITKKDVKNIIRDMHKLAMEPGMQIIHVIPQEYFIDNLPAGNDPVGMCGSRLEADFHIITGKTAAAHNIERSIKKAGLKMVGLILEPLASAASALDPQEKEAGVVLVDIGGGTTDIAIFYKNVIRHTAVIPFGGNIITNDIEEGCNIMPKQAELLKVRFGSALGVGVKENQIVSIPGVKGRPAKEISVKNLANIINSRVEEIFEQVYYEIKASGYGKKLRAGIVLTGGGSQLKSIKPLVEYVTGLDARIGEPIENLSGTYNQELKSPMYATSLGLLKRAEYEMEEVREEVFVEPETAVEEVEEKLLKNVENRPVKNWWKSFVGKFPEWLMDEEDNDYE